MKHYIACIFAMLVFACSASAESLQERVNAPTQVQTIFTSNTGKTIVTVDAAVIVPDTNEIPVYSVTVRDFTAEEGWRLAALVLPEAHWARLDGEPEYELMDYVYQGGVRQESTELNLLLPAPDRTYLSLQNTYDCGVLGRQPAMRHITYRWYEPNTGMSFVPAVSTALPETIGQSLLGQSMTIDEAAELANALVAEMDPSYALRLMLGTAGEIITGKGNAAETPEMAYCFVYTRDINGVPITYVTHELIVSEFLDTMMAPFPGEEQIIVIVYNGQVASFQWQDAYAIGEELESAVDLLSFNQILDIFGMIAPLSVQQSENSGVLNDETKNGMQIHEIRLGYMPVLKKDDPNQWELRPVWDFIGSRIHPLVDIGWPSYSLLTIDAIDGTVIDRNYGY